MGRTHKNDALNKIIGNNIRASRLKLGETQQEFAPRLGISAQQLQKYERGKDSISAGRLWELAKITKNSVSYFYNVVADILPKDRKETDRVLRLVRAWNGINDNQRHSVLDLLETIPKSKIN